MSKIKKKNELEIPKTVIGCLYGQPGTGKSTLALSAPKPLLIDTDGGVHRIQAEHRTDTVQVRSYQDILDVLEEDLSEYETLVIDTLGEFVNFMLDYFVKKDSSLITRGGTYNIKIWGLVKKEYNRFKIRVKLMNKNVIFVAHQTEDKDEEKKVYRIDVSGSTSKDVIKVLDFMGYVEMVGKKRTICFAPSERYYAKNSIKLNDLMSIPTLNDGDVNNFLEEKIIKPTIARLVAEQAENKAHEETLNACRKAIKEGEPNDVLEIFKGMDLAISDKIILFDELKASTDMIYNEETGLFEESTND